MAPAQLDAMFARAAAAGMAPYGATPEQMHLVPHRLPDAPPLENSWQRMWAASPLPSLLELLEESSHSSFEDTSLGRDVSKLVE